jgi:hypothetical protein
VVEYPLSAQTFDAVAQNEEMRSWIHALDPSLKTESRLRGHGPAIRRMAVASVDCGA